MGVEAADLSRQVLRSTETELDDTFKVSEKSRDSCRAKGVGQVCPGLCTGVRDEITNIYIAMELYGSVCHGVRQSPFLEFDRVRWGRCGPINNEPIAH